MSLTNSPYWFGGGVDSFYPTQINDSLRFEDGSSAYLNRTPSSAGNRRTWTWSGWFKRGNLSAAEQDLFSAGNSSTDRFEVILSAAYPNQLQIYMNTGGTIGSLVTSQVFRDVSAWYHLVIAFDTTQATASNRVKIYVNGSQVTDFQIATYPSQNFNTAVNSTSGQFFSRRNYVADRYYDGYMADAYMIDGQALDPTSFGEAKDGTWIPKSYSGSYGTNGFHLEFNSNTNDTSGNGNNWTANNISAHDYVPDSPTNGFATFNPLDGNATSYSEGNLRFVGDTAGNYWKGGISTFGVSSGKWYWEMYAIDGEWANVGIMPSADQRGSIASTTNIDYLLNARRYIKDGTKSIGTGSNRTTSSYGASWTTGDIIGVALDMDAGTIVFYKNGSSQGTAFTGITGVQHPHATGILSGSTIANFGQDSTFAGNTTAGGNADGNGIGSFKYAVPSSHLALCTANFPEPTIIDGSQHFNTLLWTGNGSNPRTLSGLDFAADFIWHKSRSNASMSSHAIQDSVRGFNTNNNLYTNLSGSETAYPNRGVINSVSSTGFTFNQNASDYSTADGLNENNQNFVGWNWKAGTAFSNSAGSNGATIASSGSVNADAGFSIVSFNFQSTGNQTIGHSLGVQPSMIIMKSRDSSSDAWWVYHESIGASKYLRLNSVNQSTTNSGVWSTTPTNQVFTIGSLMTTSNYGTSQIAYCFANIEGYSKAGSFIGGGSNFPFVFTGFRPAWLLIKNSSVANSWRLWDSARPSYNLTNLYLTPDNSGQEGAINIDVDLLSNGFKLRGSNSSINGSGNTMVYLAFATNPFRHSNAR